MRGRSAAVRSLATRSLGRSVALARDGIIIIAHGRTAVMMIWNYTQTHPRRSSRKHPPITKKHLQKRRRSWQAAPGVLCSSQMDHELWPGLAYANMYSLLRERCNAGRKRPFGHFGRPFPSQDGRPKIHFGCGLDQRDEAKSAFVFIEPSAEARTQTRTGARGCPLLPHSLADPRGLVRLLSLSFEPNSSRGYFGPFRID